MNYIGIEMTFCRKCFLNSVVSHQIQDDISRIVSNLKNIREDSKLWNEIHAKKKDKTTLWRLRLVFKDLEKIHETLTTFDITAFDEKEPDIDTERELEKERNTQRVMRSGEIDSGNTT